MGPVSGEPRFSVRARRLVALQNCVQLAAGSVKARSGLHPGNRRPIIMGVTGEFLLSVQGQGNPDIEMLQEMKTFRHYTDNREAHVIQRDAFADDFRRAAVPSLPQAVT